MEKGSKTFMIGMDGGGLTLKLFATAARFLTDGDQLIVYHVTNPGR